MDGENGTKTQTLLEESVTAEESETVQDIEEAEETKEAEMEERLDDISPDNSGNYEITASTVGNPGEAEVAQEPTGGVNGEKASVSEGGEMDTEYAASGGAGLEAEVTGQELEDGTPVEGSTSGTAEQEDALESPPHGKEITKEGSWTLIAEDSEMVVEAAELNNSAPEQEESPVNEMYEPRKGAQEEGPSMSEEECRSVLQEMQSENELLRQLNRQLQARLVEYFHRKSGEEALPERGKAVLEQEQRYLRYVTYAEELCSQHQQRAQLYGQQVEQLQQQVEERLHQAKWEWRLLQDLKREVVVAALARRLGKQGAHTQMEQIQAAEQRAVDKLARVRLENIRLRRATARREAALGSKDGLHLIDFEQLKIENKTYGEKIEERNEELLKLRAKLSGSVHVLTHVKEKLQLVQAEAQERRGQLERAEAGVARARDVLTHTKKARDRLRADNLRLRQRCGLLGNRALLRDMEEKVEGSTQLESKLQALKQRHSELLLCSQGGGE